MNSSPESQQLVGEQEEKSVRIVNLFFLFCYCLFKLGQNFLLVDLRGKKSDLGSGDEKK